MKAASSTQQPAYENPLMPNAKLRQMYAAMLRLRVLATSMLAGRLSPRPKRSASTVGMEACLVAATVDLTSADLVLDAFAGSAVVDFLRGTPAELALNPARRLRTAGTLAEAGSATRVIAPATGPERIWTAIGAAAALKGAAQSTGSRDGSVVVCYMRPEDLQTAAWTKALAHISAHKLPLLLVVLPGSKPQGSRTGQLATLAIRSRIPGMPVDQHDAVAIYRVASEAVGHARIGGGGALIECVGYTVEGQKTPASDAISGLANYMLQRNVADTRWMESEAKFFARRIGLQLVEPR